MPNSSGALPETLDVTVHFWFAFDIGYEIDLDHARTLLPAEEGFLQRRRRTPDSIRYRPAPLRVEIDGRDLGLPNGAVLVAPAAADLAFFDFGAISLRYQLRTRLTPAELTALAESLADLSARVDHARNAVTPWVDRIGPAVSDPEFSLMCEEYLLFQIHGPHAQRLIHPSPWIAGLVRCESAQLSTEEIKEATRLHISYTPNDLLVLDWAAGFLVDDDCADTLQVLEFVNVQLLEFRHIDDRLDDRLEAAYHLIHPDVRGKKRGKSDATRIRRFRNLPWRTHSEAVRQVRELEIEAASLFERADNALKLIGDQYLARVYSLASTRFHLNEWQENIRRKLETVGNVYDLLIHQAGGVRAEFLELVIILLIIGEIVIALIRGH